MIINRKFIFALVLLCIGTHNQLNAEGAHHPLWYRDGTPAKFNHMTPLLVAEPVIWPHHAQHFPTIRPTHR